MYDSSEEQYSCSSGSVPIPIWNMDKFWSALGYNDGGAAQPTSPAKKEGKPKQPAKPKPAPALTSHANMITVKAIHDYEATKEDELSFQAGSIITDVTIVAEGGWWEGTFNGKKGWFPDNFVEMMGSTPAPPKPAAPAAASVKAIHDYEATTEDELSFQAGSIITDVAFHAGGGWWEGTFNGKKGWFPDNFVETVRQHAKCTFDYDAVNADELSMKYNPLPDFGASAGSRISMYWDVRPIFSRLPRAFSSMVVKIFHYLG